MAASLRLNPTESFNILEDVPSTEDTQINDHRHDYGDDPETDIQQDHDDHHAAQPQRVYYQQQHPAHQDTEPDVDPEADMDDEEDQEEEFDGDASDEDTVEDSVQQDMVKLQNSFPGFRDKYRLIKRIGEGTFSTVYKAEDLQYDLYDNSWDLDKEDDRWQHLPVTQNKSKWAEAQQTRRKPKYVAIKKIYVTSSPHRIMNELDLLFALRGCPGVCPMVTAFRHHDQVVAILPYFRHADFRDYFRNMQIRDMAIYMRSLFTALKYVHRANILHRDIKPTNFLYDPETQRGVLVDFGLAERQGADSTRRCLCHEHSETRRNKLRAAFTATGNTGVPHVGYPKEDRRPSRRANRAGTRGFRAPEVLFKCTEQTPKIDIWSAGVILLTILTRRFPFFNSADDVEAMIEIATIFGAKRMKQAAQMHGCMFETSIPTIGAMGFSLERIIIWSLCREKEPLNQDERLAVDFLNSCLELDPSRRISASDALRHDFLYRNWDEPDEEEYDVEDEEIDTLEA